MKSLVELFPDSDFRHHLTLRKGHPREFFASSRSSGEELKERTQWLAADRSRYSAVVPGGELLIREFAAALQRMEFAAPIGTPVQRCRDGGDALGWARREVRLMLK